MLGLSFCGCKNLRRITQRKGHSIIQKSSADKDDQDDDYDSKVLALSFPYSFQDFRTQVYSPQQNAPVEASVPICEPFPK